MSGRGGNVNEPRVTGWRNATGSRSGASASFGVADVIALREGSRPRLIEVKSTAGGPYERFAMSGVSDRLVWLLAGWGWGR